MKERSILFSGEMVRAILDGRKTQTRRPVKKHPLIDAGFSDEFIKNPDNYNDCPFGQPGDRLWVRETWRIGAWREDGRMAIDYMASPEITKTPWVTIPEIEDLDGEKFNDYWRSITDELEEKKIFPEVTGQYHWEPGKAPLRWHPSIHMPRWASRIDLEITNNKIERIQDITYNDLEKEGLGGGEISSVIHKFYDLWDSIYLKKGYSLESNPWVWVIEFKVVRS